MSDTSSTTPVPTTATEQRVGRVGLDQIDHVFTMENHDAAYYIWRDAGVKQRSLIHIDAHHDMWWIPDPRLLTIANFICPALTGDIVREIFWVVPDQTWESPRGRKAVLRHVRRITEQYAGSCQTPKIEDNRLSTVVLGKPLTVCSLASLPPSDDSVLLDIDIDYLMIPRVSYGESDKHGALPWCWPDELLARLRTHNLRSDLVTIAYSVEGGYTPLKWKYLGDEVALRLRQPNACGPMIDGMRLMRRAALAAHAGDLATAEAQYLEAQGLLSTSPMPSHHLAHLYFEMGQISDARNFYQQALAQDPSFQCAYNNAGLQYYRDRHFRAAEREYRRVLALDPQDAYAHFGLGQLAARRKHWVEAESELRMSILLDGHSIDAYRVLGEVLNKQGRHAEAIGAYEASLKLALAGHRPLVGPIASYGDDHSVSDAGHCLIHARLARLYALKGSIDRAINGYRISIAGGYDGVLLRAKLAHLYLKRGRWQQAIQAAWEALRMFPDDVRKAGRRLRRRLQLSIRGGYRILDGVPKKPLGGVND